MLASAAEEVIRIRPVLSFRDGKIEGFDKLMAGVRAGETRQGEASSAKTPPTRPCSGQRVTADLRGPGSQAAGEAGADPRVARRAGRLRAGGRPPRRHQGRPGRPLEYQQRQRAREQITAALTVAADWELPPGLLQRQSQRELQRAVLELQRSGFSEDEIRAHENVLRQNSRVGHGPGPEGTLHPRADRRGPRRSTPTRTDYEAEIR